MGRRQKAEKRGDEGILAGLTGLDCLVTKVTSVIIGRRASVAFVGRVPKTDVDRALIIMPADCVEMGHPGKLPGERERAAWGYAVHEAGHCLCASETPVAPDAALAELVPAHLAPLGPGKLPSAGEAMAEAGRRARVAAHSFGDHPELAGRRLPSVKVADNQLRALFNACEDPRMEQVVLRRMPGAARWLEDAYRTPVPPATGYGELIQAVLADLSPFLDLETVAPPGTPGRAAIEIPGVRRVLDAFRPIAMSGGPGRWPDALNAAMAIWWAYLSHEQEPDADADPSPQSSDDADGEEDESAPLDDAPGDGEADPPDDDEADSEDGDGEESSDDGDGNGDEEEGDEDRGDAAEEGEEDDEDGDRDSEGESDEGDEGDGSVGDEGNQDGDQGSDDGGDGGGDGAQEGGEPPLQVGEVVQLVGGGWARIVAIHGDEIDAVAVTEAEARAALAARR